MTSWVRRATRDSVHRARTLTGLGLRLVKIVVLRALRSTDHRRWASPQNLEAWWDERTRLLAELVPPGSRVIEFGAGRRQLERYLDPSCTYIPSDLVDRGPGTIVCDLNQRPLPDLSGMNLDVAVFGGVLEYISDVGALLAWLPPSVTRCVTSYAYVEHGIGPVDRASRYIERWRNGYMNQFTEQQIVDLFAARGFICRDRRSWQGQRIFLLERPANPWRPGKSALARDFSSGGELPPS